MRTIRRVGCVVGAVLVALFLASITASLVAPQDERCDNCLRLMVPMYDYDLQECRVIAYRCPDKSCDQRGQRTVWKDGRREWEEW